MEGLWTVVIPSDNEYSLAISAGSVLAMHRDLLPSRIVVVTRKIDPSQVRESLKGLTYVLDSGPFVFSRSINLGFQATGESDVIVMGDDVELVSSRGFDLLQEEAPLRILAPVVRGRVGPWWQKEGNAQVDVPFISFTCVYIPRSVYKIVGPMEEGFPGYGYEDTDYCLRVRQSGLSCGVSSRVVVEHSVRVQSAFISTYKEDMGAMELKAKKAFEKKWAGLVLPPHKLAP